MTKIYADGAEPEQMIQALKLGVSGFTTNPTLMRKAKVAGYETFIKYMLKKIPDHPISFEVIADELPEMERQAHKLASFGENVYVKIPITNTMGVSTCTMIGRLLSQGVKVNVTAVFTFEQIMMVCENLKYETPAILSIFAGRIADTGRNPVEYMRYALGLIPPNVEILWASCREVYNIYEAMSVGCHIITVPNNLIEKKIVLQGMDLTKYSLETVKMFYDDAQGSNLKL